MKDHNQHEIQMSEAFLNSAFLALSGGFQDAYTYNARNEVFCNAQTGNVVLMSQHFMAGELTAGLGYFFPIIFFALGVWVAEKIQANYKYAQKLHWRQGTEYSSEKICSISSLARMTKHEPSAQNLFLKSAIPIPLSARIPGGF